MLTLPMQTNGKVFFCTVGMKVVVEQLSDHTKKKEAVVKSKKAAYVS